MRVTVVVPWRGGCPARERAWRWVAARFAARHPAWTVTRSELPATGPWRKGLAVERAVRHLDGIVVISDADVWTDNVGWAVVRVAAGTPWAVPHMHVHRLGESATERVLAGTEPRMDMALVQRPYRGTAGGGVVVMPAATAREIPIDPRFAGWGGEDGAWRDALRCLAGREARGMDTLWHLWHPPQDRMTRQVGTEDNAALAVRYARARTTPESMRALIAEGAAGG